MTVNNNKFVLDANVFIEARKRYYAFDLCPAFWDSLLVEHINGHLLSIDRIKDELTDPEIANWVSGGIPDAYWDNSRTQDVANSYAQMMAWVQANTQFKPEAKAEFATVADGWLVAYAHAHNYIVVTEEKYSKDVRKKVPIPNVCLEFNVLCVDTFDMLRALGCKFT